MLNLIGKDSQKILEKTLKKKLKRKADNIALVLNMLWDMELQWTEIPQLFHILDVYLTAAGTQGIIALERLLHLQKGDTKEAYKKIWQRAGLRRLYLKDSMINIQRAFNEGNQEQLDFAVALERLFLKSPFKNMQHFLAYYSPFYYFCYFLPFGQGNVDFVNFLDATAFYESASESPAAFSESMPQGFVGDLGFLTVCAILLTAFLYFFIDYIGMVSNFLTLGLQHIYTYIYTYIYTHVSNIFNRLFAQQKTQKILEQDFKTS